MGHMCGDFIPTEEYKLIKKEVQQYWISMDEFPEKWHSFRFNVQLENGYFILPAGGYMIFDFPDSPEEPITFHIAGVHSHIYEDYFENNKQFLMEPWHTINIEQKIDFEDELFKEIRYKLKDISALAKHRFKDEVLFAIDVKNMPPFGIAHLIPGQKMRKIGEVIPEENCFEEFDDFINKRMVPDNESLGNS